MHVVSIDDTKLHIHDSGSGPPLLFVHGFPLDHTMWQAQIDEFQSTHRVIVPDLRGFGQSDVTTGTVTMQQFADDLNGLLDALEVAEPVTFCGLSMGGYIGWPFVVKYSDRVARLVMCDTRAGADSDEAKANRQRVADSVLTNGTAGLAKAMPAKLLSKHTLAERPDVVTHLQRMITKAPPEGVAAASRGMAERSDFTDQLGDVKVPTLLIVGSDDALTPPAEMQSISKLMPNARYAEIPSAGHMSPMESPGEFNMHLRAFLSDVPR